MRGLFGAQRQQSLGVAPGLAAVAPALAPLVVGPRQEQPRVDAGRPPQHVDFFRRQAPCAAASSAASTTTGGGGGGAAAAAAAAAGA